MVTKSINRFIRIISFFIVLSSCSSSPELVQVRLEFDNLSKQWIYLCQWNGNQNVVIDSVRANSRGKAKLEFRTHTADMFAITANKNDFPIVIVANPGDRIKIMGDFRNFTVVGSKESANVKLIQEKFNGYRVALESLRCQLPDSVNTPTTDSIARVINLKIDSLKAEFSNFGKSYVSSNLFSLSSVLVLTASVGDMDVLPYSENRPLYIKVDSCLNSIYSDKPIVKSFRNYIYSKEKYYSIDRNTVNIKVGDVMPPVSFTMVDGKTVNIPGVWAKLILVDFWASWCETCQNQPYLYKDINKEFSKKGLLIIQVAADFNADSLLAISTRDSLNWMHVAENDAYGSTLFKLLGVSKLPANFLVDRWGRVVATNIYGDSLVSKLNSILDVKVLKPRVKVDSSAIKALTPVQ